MTIYTTAAKVAKHNVCEGGQERTAAALAREGKTMDTRVTMQNILQSLGLTDALYSFVEVEKESRKEADTVLREYMRKLAGHTSTMIMMTSPGLGTILAEANKAINKRCDGLKREQMMRRQHVAILRARQQVQRTELRYWLQAYAELLTSKPDHLVAVHATVAFTDGCKAVGIGAEGLDKMTKELADLLGQE